MPVDPQCQVVLDAASAKGAPFAHDDYLAIRAAYAATTAVYRPDPVAPCGSTDRAFPGPGGDVKLRVYVPETSEAEPLACLVYFHGGGWVVGDLDTHDHVCRHLAHGSGACVVAVDYRLAPEHPFPAGFDDCLAAVRWVGNHAAELNVDGSRIAIGGDSAGGNLAAAVAIGLRDGGGPEPRLQLLIYPGTDFTADNESLRDNAEGYLLTRGAMELFSTWYLGDPALRSDPRASPQLRSTHRGLPRAFIQTAEFDPLRDEARTYAKTLAAAGCPVEYKCYPGMLHGFVRMGGIVDCAIAALDDACGVISEAL